MNYLKLLWFMFRLLWRPALQTILILGSIIYLPINIVGIFLSILIWTFLFKIFKEMPRAADWFKQFLITSLFFTVVMLLYYFLGSLGIVLFVLIPVLFAAYSIFSQWSLFDEVTTWGAKRIKGSKDDFDWTKVK
jgi:hypothetical protein